MASRSRCSYAVTVASDLDSSRLDASSPNLKDHGPPIPAGRGPVERIPRRDAMRRPQRSLAHSPDTQGTTTSVNRRELFDAIARHSNLAAEPPRNDIDS